MHGKNACIIVDLRTGEHLAKVPAIVTVLEAAGWKTRVSLKEYGGETLKLAQKAARNGYDLVIGYGGDGTLNAVFNGVVNAQGKSTVADIPGGTFNTWAGAIGIPEDPVKAALTLLNSQARMVDLGHIEVEGLFSRESESPINDSKKPKKPKQSAKIRQYFLLNVGMGFDAKMMAHINKPLKYRVGPLAFDLSMLKELPEQRPFPVEVTAMYDANNVATRWQGEVWEVLVSKVPLFAGSMNIEPEARADDGQLYVCLITANGPMKTVQQVVSMLAQHRLDEESTHYFKAPHFSIRVPAAITIHVDGSITKIEDFLHKSEQDVLKNAPDNGQIVVNYRFDAKPQAVQMAIPRTYSGALFTQYTHDENTERQASEKSIQQNDNSSDRADGVQAQGTVYNVTVIGVTPHPEQQNTYIVAGNYQKQDTGETETVAIPVNGQVPLSNDRDGQSISFARIAKLQEGEEIVVRGDKSKRNIIKAYHINLVA